MSLEELQRAFAAELLEEGSTAIDTCIAADPIGPLKRINVYRNNFRSNHRAALTTAYPVLRKLVGSDFFHFLANEYVSAYPSRAGDLRHLGQYLPDFLIDYDPVKTLPYIADVARLEWAGMSVLNDASSIRLVRSEFPIFTIWSVNQDSYAGDQFVSLNVGPQSVLVLRRNDQLELWSLNESDANAAAELLSALDRVANAEPEVSGDLDFSLDQLLTPSLLLRYGHD